jgi:outer membrane protein assembly factor BamE (lipoprotein component of BamABCDE complex)
MNTKKVILLPIVMAVICACLCGCATSTVTRGKDFDGSKVSQVVKGKTTADEITTMFGSPNSKTPVNADEERWVYSYVTATAHATAFGGSVHSEVTGGHKKILNLYFKNGIVVNFTFEDGPIEPYKQDTRQN